MRSVPAVALLIALSALAGGRSSAASDAPTTAPPFAATPPAPAAAPAPVGKATSADNDAAARHAKRAACINQARTKKLVGGQKTAYIKDCVGTP